MSAKNGNGNTPATPAPAAAPATTPTIAEAPGVPEVGPGTLAPFKVPQNLVEQQASKWEPERIGDVLEGIYEDISIRHGDPSLAADKQNPGMYAQFHIRKADGSVMFVNGETLTTLIRKGYKPGCYVRFTYQGEQKSAKHAKVGGKFKKFSILMDPESPKFADLDEARSFLLPRVGGVFNDFMDMLMNYSAPAAPALPGIQRPALPPRSE